MTPTEGLRTDGPQPSVRTARLRRLRGERIAEPIGSLAWTRRTRGRLSRREVVAYIARGAQAQLAALPDYVTTRLGLRRERLASLDLAALGLPDTAAAREAEAIAEELPPFLREHSYRSYLWGAAIGTRERLDFDAELLYTGCLVHDAGLVPDHRPPEGCFTLGSAAAGERCGTRGGWTDDRTRRLGEIITLHINPRVTVNQTVEGHLLATGTTLDAIAGRGLWHIERPTVDAVLARHPRFGVGRELEALCREEARREPRARIACLYRYAGLALLFRLAPFDE